MKISSIVLSAMLFASVQQSNASYSEPKIMMKDLALTQTVNKRCQETFKGFDFLQTAEVDFNVSASLYETRPLWPLICSVAQKSERVHVQNMDYGVTITFSFKGKSPIRYDFVSTDNNAFEIGAFNKNIMDNYNSQKSLLESLTAIHDEVMAEN